MKAPLVCVIVVNYNGAAYLSRCVAALRAQRFRDFEAIIVDNGSTDGSADALAPLPSGFKLLRAGQNLGFSAANNLAAREASAPWLATLNPDAFAEPDWLERLMLALERHPEAVMLGSTQLDFKRPDRLDGAGDVYHVVGLAWRGDHGRARGHGPVEGETFGPCAAGALYRRDAFLAAGGFDERFFCYCEDIDLAFRLRLAGATCIQVADAVIRHVGSGITGARSDFAVYHGTRNRLWTFVKNMPGPLFWPLLPVHLLANLMVLQRSLVQGTFRPTARGLLDGFRGLGPIWAARRDIQRKRCASTADIARALTWSPMTLLRRASDIRPVAGAKASVPPAVPPASSGPEHVTQ